MEGGFMDGSTVCGRKYGRLMNCVVREIGDMRPSTSRLAKAERLAIVYFFLLFFFFGCLFFFLRALFF